MQKDQRTVGGNSNEMQDVAAALLLGRNKKFLDLGAASAKTSNNTYLLQKKLGWDGLCFDLREEGTVKNDHKSFNKEGGDYKERGISLHNVDCTTPAFLNILKEHSFPKVVDYVSLDLDAASIEGLLNLVHTGGYIFKFLTYEHDLHYSRNHEIEVRGINQKGALNKKEVYENPSREYWRHPFSKEGIDARKYRSKDILQERGYSLLFEDVSIEVGSSLHPMEDWWINPQYFPADITSFGGKNLHFSECIKRLINISAFLHTKETFDLIKEHCFEDLHS